jgi:putative hemolysin
MRPPCPRNTPPTASAAVLAELTSCELLVASGEYQVLAVDAADHPETMEAIGRLRTTSFRAAGMGAASEVDLDDYDDRYVHLVLFDVRARVLAGAYRLGWCADLIAAQGAAGLYTASLFALGPGFIDRLGSAVEVGRSCLHPHYHRRIKPLGLLWRGIGELMARRDGCHVLMGSVSIPAALSAESRSLILSTLRAHTFHDALAARVEARTPPDLPAVAPAKDLLDLNSRVRARDGRPLPVLLRKYARLGGRFFGFNVDHDFGDSIDALVWVDLRDTPVWALEGYVGETVAARLQGRA